MAGDRRDWQPFALLGGTREENAWAHGPTFLPVTLPKRIGSMAFLDGYGAVGNNAADDRPFFEEARVDLEALGGGVILLDPAKTYFVSSGWVIAKDKNIHYASLGGFFKTQGSGARIRFGGNATGIKYAGNPNPAGNADLHHGGGIHNVRLEGNAAMAWVVELENVDTFFIDNASIVNGAGALRAHYNGATFPLPGVVAPGAIYVRGLFVSSVGGGTTVKFEYQTQCEVWGLFMSGTPGTHLHLKCVNKSFFQGRFETVAVGGQSCILEDTATDAAFDNSLNFISEPGDGRKHYTVNCVPHASSKKNDIIGILGYVGTAVGNATPTDALPNGDEYHTVGTDYTHVEARLDVQIPAGVTSHLVDLTTTNRKGMLFPIRGVTPRPRGDIGLNNRLWHSIDGANPRTRFTLHLATALASPLVVECTVEARK